MDEVIERCDVNDVIITGDLHRRPSRAPDYQAENEALTSLAQAMSANPDSVLQHLVEVALTITRSDSAGISLLEPGGEDGTFRWAATAGACSPYRDGTMPREASPCGEVIAREAVLLVRNPERAFPALLQADPPINEGLLAPFHLDGVPVGTIWTIKHGPDDHFEAEDARLLESLAQFASAAHRMAQAIQSAVAVGEGTELRLQQLVALADVSSEFFGTCDMEFMPIYGNAAAMRMVGLAGIEQVKRTPLQEFFFPEDLAFITEEFFPRVLREGQGKVEIRFRHFVTGEPVWVDYSLVVLKDETGRATGFGTVTHDLTERKRTEAALRESEERQAFLLKLSDALRAEPSAEAIANRALRMLLEQMRLDRCYVGIYRLAEDIADLPYQVHDHRLPPLPAQVRLSDFPKAFEIATDRTLVIDDVGKMEGLSDSDRASIDCLGVGALLAATLRKGENNPLWAIVAVSTHPRVWTPGEVALVEEVAERTWAAVEREGAETALRQSEERFRTVTEAIEDVFYMTDLDQRALMYLSPSFERVWGLPREMVMRDLSAFSDTVHPDDRAVVAAAKRRQQEGLPVTSEYRIVRPDGTTRWISDRCFPVAGDRMRRSAGIAADITEGKETADALYDSEAQFRQFSDASTDVLWIRDAETLEMVFASLAFDRTYGIAGPDRGGDGRLQNWARLIEPENRKSVLANFRRVRAGERVEQEFQIRHATNGARRWIHDTDFPLRDAAGVVRWVAGLGADITDAREATDRQGVLVAELQHRTRNLIAVVRSLSDRSLDSSASLDDFGARFRMRLSALARVQGLLSHLAVGDKVTFKELLCSELAAHGATDDSSHNVTLDGPDDVPLRSSTVQTFALALHELATNALKYGALASPTGRLLVNWHVQPAPAGGQARLHVEWRESNVVMPKVSAPAKRGGYGRELIERALPYQLKAKTTYVLGVDGLRCTIALPIGPVSGGASKHE